MLGPIQSLVASDLPAIEWTIRYFVRTGRQESAPDQVIVEAQQELTDSAARSCVFFPEWGGKVRLICPNQKIRSNFLWSGSTGLDQLLERGFN